MKAPHRRSKFLSLAAISCAAIFAAHGAAQKRAVQEENIPEATTGEMPEDAVCAEMERAVDAAVWADWRRTHPAPFWLFGEERRLAVRNNIIPAHWFADGSEAAKIFHGRAQPGEWYAFQVCVASDKARELAWEAKTPLAVTRITPRECRVAAGGVKPIWVMVDIPKDAASKTFTGEVAVRDATTGESAALPFEIFADGPVLEDGGVADAWRLARLKWLNSGIGREDTLVKPYTPVEVDRATRTVKILGRELVLGENGLPKQLVSYFSGSNTRIGKDGTRLLSGPFEFILSSAAAGKAEFAFTEISQTRASWEAATEYGAAKVSVQGAIDFTGSCSFRIRVHGAAPKVSARLRITMDAANARFLDGFGRKGGELEDGAVLEQEWNDAHCRDSLWIGRVNGAFAIRFKDANYRRPLINAYYKWRKILLPASWAANGKIRVAKSGGSAVVEAWGEDVPADAEWNFDLYLTPFHPLDMKAHLADRYCHLKMKTKTFDAAAIRRKGATVVNVHHNTLWNPYINYPFSADGEPLLHKMAEEAHAAGLKLKPYYTTRELTQNMPEFFALKSLDGEVVMERDASVPGWPITNRRGPHPWLKAHVGEDIIPAWRETVDFSAHYAPRLDLAVITTPETRWDNFYLEGLDYLVRKHGIDGLYIDDTALSGESMRRARRILGRDGKRRLVDNHSWTHHNPLAGGNSTNLAFIDLYPYFDLLWRGEGFNNNTPAGFWLVERSGIPFGIPGEMLGKGDPVKGLVFGMTDRMGWGSRKGSPQCMWKFFDETGLGDMEFIGWWDDACPVRTAGDAEIKASVWKGAGKTVLAIANFSDSPKKAVFSFDGGAAGWTRPAIENVQRAGAAPDFAKPVEIPANGGFILVSREEAK